MIRHMVLRLLAERPASGYAICSRIESACGQRPSYGSIYPLLERFMHDGLVTVSKQGRSKVYSLTKKGREATLDAERQRVEILGDEVVRIRRLMELMEMDPEPMLAMLERAKRGEPPLGPITAKMFALRDLVFRMAQDGRTLKHREKINVILEDTTRRLERLK